MNRRKFLKRIAAVAAGAVAAPAVVKTLLFKPNPAQRLIIGGHDEYIILHGKDYPRQKWPTTQKFIWRRIDTVTVLDSTPDPGEVYISRNTSLYPEYEIGEIIILSNGHVYKYTKAVG